MFWNIYSKRLLFSFRDRDSLIWTWIFPILLGTMFFAVFSGLDTIGQLRRFPVGIINDEAYRHNPAFQLALESVSGEDGLFELIVFADAGEADSALEEGSIAGYIMAGDIPTLFALEDQINQTIIKGFLDRFVQTRSLVETIIATNPEAAHGLQELMTPATYTQEISLSRNPPTNRVNYFYALLAMVCMYGGFQGLTSVTYLQANLSALGVRRTLSPAPRWRVIVYDLLGAVTVQFLCMITVVAYLAFLLRVDFGPQLFAVVLTCLVGGTLGVAFGAMVSAVSKQKETVKVAILITVTMVCSFLAGLMVSGVNYVVAQRAPAVAWLNPAARIADAFYCLYYYDNYERYFQNIGIIVGLTVIMLLVTALFIRRQRYESI